MRITPIISFLFLLSVSSGQKWGDLPTECPSSVCIGVDSSRGLTRKQFQLQKSYVRVTMRALSRANNSTYQVVSYASANDVLVPATSNFTLAAQALDDLTYSPNEFAVLSGPIVFCDSKLRNEERNGKKIVLFSSGLNNLGGDPVRRAHNFRERAMGEIFVLAIGERRNNETLMQIAGAEDNFIPVENGSWPIRNRIVVALVQKLCQTV